MLEKERAIMRQQRHSSSAHFVSFKATTTREAKARKRDFFSNFSHKHVSTMLAINFLALANPEKEKKGWLCRWMKTRFWGCTKEMNSVQILSLARRDKKNRSAAGKLLLSQLLVALGSAVIFTRFFFLPQLMGVTFCVGR